MIRLTRPELGGSAEAIGEVIRDGFLVQGANVRRFEAAVADYVGRKHAVAVNSGTSAIQCALVAAGVTAGDEVIVPDFTFPATANAVITCGATPVLADIDLETFNINPDEVTARLSKKTRAVMPVDLFGLAADLDALAGITAARNLLLIEDSACALGSTLNGRMCGAFGEASVISFHPRKVVTTGEGGMVLTDRADLAERVRRLRNHGIDASGAVVEFVEAGYNLRLTEIQACLGLAQIDRVEELIAGRRRAAALYDQLLKGAEGIRLPVEPEGRRHTYQSYVVLVDDAVDRDRLIAAMRAAGVETAIGTYAVHHQPFYARRFGYKPGSLPASSRAFKHSLALPMYSSMEEATVREVVARLRDCMARA
jgi:perosamine synthetase